MSAGGAGVSLGTRRPLTLSSHPSCAQVPSQVTRPGSDWVSVTWPALHVARTRTRALRAVEVLDTVGNPSVKALNAGRQPAEYTPVKPKTVLEDYRPRLEAAARDVADAKTELELAITARNELVVDAVDHGMTQLAVANAAGVSQPTVTKILTLSQAEDGGD